MLCLHVKSHSGLFINKHCLNSRLFIHISQNISERNREAYHNSYIVFTHYKILTPEYFAISDSVSITCVVNLLSTIKKTIYNISLF